ncbi:MAG: conjugal transfer protein [Ruminococcus sp.]|nr:conjugal transfer protein [Ruminococcus sp.]
MREGRAICPACGGRTQVVIQSDTVLINFPFFCKKCKTTTLVEYGLSLSQRA